MKRASLPFLLGALAWILPITSSPGGGLPEPAWPGFRGPNASGVADDAHPPLHFGPDTNLAWRVSAPSGCSSPIVAGDRLFLTALSSNQLVTLAYDTRDGHELWRRTAPATNIESCHRFSSPAAPTPCTDGQRVYSYFGSFGLLAYDLDGHEVWQRPFELLPAGYGTATSPILAAGRLILQRDGDSTNSELVALDPSTGKTLWSSPRPLATACYATPMVWHHDGIDELMVQGRGRVAAYDLEHGEMKWWVKGWGFSAITTPVAGDDMLFVGGSGMGDPGQPQDPIMQWSTLIQYDANHDGQLALSEIPADLTWHIRKELSADAPGNSFKMRELLSIFVDANHDNIITKAEWDAMDAFSKDKFNADRFVGIRPGGNSDSTESHVVWETTRGLSELPSSIYYRGRVGFFRDGGLWTSLEAKTGKRLLDRERLGIGGQSVASPIAANGRIYVANEAGTFAVLSASDQLEVLAVNKLGESVRCTPALAGNRLYVRTAEHLWAFSEK